MRSIGSHSLTYSPHAINISVTNATGSQLKSFTARMAQWLAIYSLTSQVLMEMIVVTAFVYPCDDAICAAECDDII